MSPHLSSLSLGAMSVGWVGITAVGSEAEFFSETMRLKVWKSSRPRPISLTGANQFTLDQIGRPRGPDPSNFWISETLLLDLGQSSLEKTF